MDELPENVPVPSRMAAARAIARLSPKNTIVMVCDMQEKFRNYTKFFPEITITAKRIIDAAKILEMKTIVTEHYSQGLGKTVGELGLDEKSPTFCKNQWSMCIPQVEDHLKGAKNVLLVGLETHVCVLNTTYDLLERGIDVHVIVDAVSSRTTFDRKYGFKQMERAGAILTTSECAILGLVGGADHPKFKEIQKIIWEASPDVELTHKA